MKTRPSILQASDSQESEINISPLIDVVFILLIFFIVTTVFVEETGVEIQRPQATSAAQLQKEVILIAITAEGSVVHGGREISAQGVRGVVKRILKKEDRPVIIQADKNASIDLYTRVHDEAIRGGAKIVNLATLK